MTHHILKRSTTVLASGGGLPSFLTSAPILLLDSPIGDPEYSDAAEVDPWINSGTLGNFTNVNVGQKPFYRSSGINGNASADFDGVNDALTLAGVTAFNGATSFTLAVVFQHDIQTGFRVIAEQGTASTTRTFLLTIFNGNTQFYIRGGTVNTVATPFVPGDRVFILIEWDGTTCEMYINDMTTPVDSDPYSTAMPTAVDHVSVGGRAPAGTYTAGPFDGDISHFMAIPRALAADERAEYTAYLINRYNIT